jgi:hypothetical protein
MMRWVDKQSVIDAHVPVTSLSFEHKIKKNHQGSSKLTFDSN